MENNQPEFEKRLSTNPQKILKFVKNLYRLVEVS